MNCQHCGLAEAEWKVKEMLAETGSVVRWWYLCDVCVMEDFGPWIGKRLLPLEDDQVWVSKEKRVYRRASA